MCDASRTFVRSKALPTELMPTPPAYHSNQQGILDHTYVVYLLTGDMVAAGVLVDVKTTTNALT